MLTNKIAGLAAQAFLVPLKKIVAYKRRATNGAGPSQTGGRAFPILAVSNFLAPKNEEFRFGPSKKSDGEGVSSLSLWTVAALPIEPGIRENGVTKRMVFGRPNGHFTSGNSKCSGNDGTPSFVDCRLVFSIAHAVQSKWEAAAEAAACGFSILEVVVLSVFPFQKADAVSVCQNTDTRSGELDDALCSPVCV
jgi:hypothetical protein